MFYLVGSKTDEVRECHVELEPYLYNCVLYTKNKGMSISIKDVDEDKLDNLIGTKKVIISHLLDVDFVSTNESGITITDEQNFPHDVTENNKEIVLEFFKLLLNDENLKIEWR